MVLKAEARETRRSLNLYNNPPSVFVRLLVDLRGCARGYENDVLEINKPYPTRTSPNDVPGFEIVVEDTAFEKPIL